VYTLKLLEVLIHLVTRIQTAITSSLFFTGEKQELIIASCCFMRVPYVSPNLCRDIRRNLRLAKVKSVKGVRLRFALKKKGNPMSRDIRRLEFAHCADTRLRISALFMPDGT